MFANNQIISEYLSFSVEETKDIGKKIAKDIPKNNKIAFLGDLGSGKTTFIKALVNQINDINEDLICSPTFTYLNIYTGKINIYHFDLYRIKDIDQFLAMGFDEYFDQEGICLIEWSEKILSLLPPKTLVIHIIAGEKECERKITMFEL